MTDHKTYEKLSQKIDELSLNIERLNLGDMLSY